MAEENKLGKIGEGALRFIGKYVSGAIALAPLSSYIRYHLFVMILLEPLHVGWGGSFFQSVIFRSDICSPLSSVGAANNRRISFFL